MWPHSQTQRRFESFFSTILRPYDVYVKPPSPPMIRSTL